jgi:hypothetical protein
MPGRPAAAVPRLHDGLHRRCGGNRGAVATPDRAGPRRYPDPRLAASSLLIAAGLPRPSLIAEAVAPSVAALLIDHVGNRETLGIVVGIALFNVALTLVLAGRTGRARTSPSSH